MSIKTVTSCVTFVNSIYCLHFSIFIYVCKKLAYKGPKNAPKQLKWQKSYTNQNIFENDPLVNYSLIEKTKVPKTAKHD